MSMKSKQMLKQRDTKPSEEIDPEHAEERHAAKQIQRRPAFGFGNRHHAFLINASVDCRRLYSFAARHFRENGVGQIVRANENIRFP